MKSNNKSFGHVFFTVLGLILLTLIITAAVLFFVCRAKMAGAELHLDDVLRYAQSESDSRTQHLSFSADAKMTLTLDKSDIWYFLYRYYGEDWLRDTNETLSTLHLELTGLGLDINEDGMTFDVEMYHKKTRLAFSVYCKAYCSDNVITVRPTHLIILGHRVSLARFTSTKLAKLLRITKENIAFTYTPQLTFMKEIETVALGDGTLSLTGEMTTDYLEQNVISSLRIMVMRFAQKECCYIGPVLNDYCSDPVICYSSLLPYLQADPTVFTVFLRQFFALKSPKFFELEKKNESIIYRWFPDFKDDYTDESFEAKENYEIACKILKSAADYTSSSFTAKNFSIAKGKLKYKKSAFKLESFYGGNYGKYCAIMDLENSRPCLYIRSTVGYGDFPAISKIIDSKKSLSTAGVELELGYAPGLLLRGADNFPYVLAFTGGENYEAMVLDEGYFHELMETEAFPVVDLRSSA